MFQDRRSFVGSESCLNPLQGSTGGGPGGPVSVVNGSFASTHRLRHTPSADFQPPYFPPPYSVPQAQPADFAHHPGIGPDPYSHLSHHHYHYTSNHQPYLGPSDRNLLGAPDSLTGPLPRTFPGSYDPRRPEYVPVSRQELFLSTRTSHELSDASLQLALHHGGLALNGIDDGNQVRWVSWRRQGA